MCDEIVDIEIDNMIDCNLISEGLLEPLRCEDAVRRFNGKLKGTFNGKERKVEALGYIRTRVGFGSFEGTFMLIVVSNRVLDSDVVLSAQGLSECHNKLLVSHEKIALYHESNLMKPTSVVFEKLPKTSMIMMDKEMIGTKKKVSMWNAEETKKPNTSMVSEQTTMNEIDLTTITCSRRSDNDDSSGSRMLLEAPTEVNPKQHLIEWVCGQPSSSNGAGRDYCSPHDECMCFHDPGIFPSAS